MIALNADINNYHAPKTVIDSTRVLSGVFRPLNGIIKGISGVFLLILLIPFAILSLVLLYPIALIGLSYLKRVSSKLLKETKSDLKSLDYKEAKEYYSEIQKTINSIKSINADSPELDISILRPINRRVLSVYTNFSEIELILRRAMFVDTSNDEYTDKEKALFTELSDFFGEDEAYKEDTFHQLKKESA